MAHDYLKHLKAIWCQATSVPSCLPDCKDSCDDLHRHPCTEVSARGCRCVENPELVGQHCTLQMVVQQVILESSPLTPSSLLGIVGQSRYLHVEVEPVKVRNDAKPWPKSGPGELQSRPPMMGGSGEVWLWGRDAVKSKGAKLQLETMDTAELVLRVMETRSRWRQEAIVENRGEALFVPAFSVHMQTDLTLPLQKDGRICGMIRVTAARDGWEMYLTDPQKETLVQQVSPMFDPDGHRKVQDHIDRMNAREATRETTHLSDEEIAHQANILYVHDESNFTPQSNPHQPTLSPSKQPREDSLRPLHARLLGKQKASTLFSTNVPEAQNVALPPPMLAHPMMGLENAPLPAPSGIDPRSDSNQISNDAFSQISNAGHGGHGVANGQMSTPMAGLGGGPGGMLSSGPPAAAGATERRAPSGPGGMMAGFMGGMKGRTTPNSSDRNL